MKTYLRQLKRLANLWLPNYLAIHNADRRVRTSTVEVYVELLEEGTPTVRATQALVLPNGLYIRGCSRLGVKIAPFSENGELVFW
jgi:hypothetical protein